MNDEDLYIHWLELPSNEPIPFENIARLLAEARHPVRVTELDDISMGASWLQYERDLDQAVKENRLRVRNSLTGAFHSFPYGDALKKAVVFPVQDLRPFLAEIGMGLRIGVPTGQHTQSGNASVEVGVAMSAPRPLQRHEAQEIELLQTLQQLGYDPLALPTAPRGKPGPKAAARSALGQSGPWAGTTVFDKAWDRLRASGQLKDAT